MPTTQCDMRDRVSSSSPGAMGFSCVRALTCNSSDCTHHRSRRGQVRGAAHFCAKGLRAAQRPDPCMSRTRGSTLLASAPLILWAGWKRARVELRRVEWLVSMEYRLPSRRGPHHHETGQLATRVPLGTLTNARALPAPDFGAEQLRAGVQPHLDT
eukprot:scaffold29526_cov73-Phaeocystis_antarctica.AAC.3